jgi:hypothetical protein
MVKYVFTIIILFGCKTSKIEIVKQPSETKITPYGTIQPTDGKENAKRMKYYNSLQHKTFYKQKIVK